MCTYMATKNISIMEDVYNLLLKNRLGNESFSDIIRRRLSKKRDIMEFAGAWKDVSEEEIEDMKNIINRLGENASRKLIKKYRK